MKNTAEIVKEFVKVKFGVDIEPKVDEFNRFKFGSAYDIGTVWFSESTNTFIRTYAYHDRRTEDKILVEERYSADYDLIDTIEC